MSVFDLMLWKDLQKGSLLASDAINAHNKAVNLGLLELEPDIQNAKPYDHDHPSGKYEEKNLYFNRANSIGISFLRQNATGFSKMYYWIMLNAINTHEKKAKKPLNKGMVCGNLGASSLAEGDIDGGIAYLAWAMREDRYWVSGNPENSIFASPLYVQFAEGTHRGGASQFGRDSPWVMLKKALNNYSNAYKTSVDISSIFKELENSPEHRALFEGALWTVHRNSCILNEEKERKIYENENNIFTRLRLFDGIITLCRFVELRMRHHEPNLKILSPSDLNEAMEGTLGRLLGKIFGANWFKTEVSKPPRFTKSKAFDAFLKRKLTTKVSNTRNLLLLLVIRNYSVHLCDPNVPFFFENIEQIFDEIIFAYVYYLEFRKLI